MKRVAIVILSLLPALGATSPHATFGPVGIAEAKWTGGLSSN